jgi:hypothetical protein
MGLLLLQVLEMALCQLLWGLLKKMVLWLWWWWWLLMDVWLLLLLLLPLLLREGLSSQVHRQLGRVRWMMKRELLWGDQLLLP